MRVLLIQPPYDLYNDDERQAMPPLGLAYIAAVLERDGHEVRIIDCVAECFHQVVPLPDGRRRHGLNGEPLKAQIRTFAPRIVGVSCLFSAQSPAAHHVCRLIKQTDPSIRTIMGGAHPSAVPEEVLADPAVDLAAVGEGELTMLNLVRAMQSGRDLPENPAGLAYRGPAGVQVCKPALTVEQLDDLPIPARHLLPMDRYFRYRSPHGAIVKRHPCTNVITSRGCPAQCNFCSIHTVWGRRFRWHSTERVIAEIKHLIDDYGVREIQFEDDNLTLHKPRTKEICQAILDHKLDITWTTPNGVAIWALDEPLIRLMRQAGCYHITLAIESGSQRVLREVINKPLDLGRVRPMVEACRRAGMGISTFFVVGFPGETRAELQQTFDLGLSLDVDQALFFTATPYPGTKLYQECLDTGRLSAPVDYAQLRVGRPFISTPEWTAAELDRMTRDAQARCYRRAAIHRPVRFLASAARKFYREPRLACRKALDVLGRKTHTTPPVPSPRTLPDTRINPVAHTWQPADRDMQCSLPVLPA